MSERDLEEEYFAKREREKLAALKADLDQEAASRAVEERRELHYHRCGKCGDAMVTKGYRGVEIEVCPTCGAVLLDPGELQQLAGEDRSGVLKGMLSFFGKD